MDDKQRLSELVREAFFCPEEFLYIECEDCSHNESGLCLMMGQYLVEHDVVIQKQGHWKSDGIAAMCDQCETAIVIEQYSGDMNYCMNCGAKLVGEHERKAD